MSTIRENLCNFCLEKTQNIFRYILRVMLRYNSYRRLGRRVFRQYPKLSGVIYKLIGPTSFSLSGISSKGTRANTGVTALTESAQKIYKMLHRFYTIQYDEHGKSKSAGNNST